MPRALLLLIAVLMLLGLPARFAPEQAFDAVALADSEGCDCCPGEEDEQGDCCDVDFGSCCASTVFATPVIASLEIEARATAQPESAGVAAMHLSWPRDNGPPPTPPPIG